jgi:protein-disulfide isomerase
MKQLHTLLTVACVSLFLTGCNSDKNFKENLVRTLNANPEIVTEIIEKNPAVFMEALQKAAKVAQDDMRKKSEDAEKQNLEDSFKNPIKMTLRSDESIRGNKDSKITLYSFSDFECPFCTRGFNTAKELMEKHGNNIKYVFRHLPLSFHPDAMIAAKYYEAIRLQDEQKAFKFHDEIFNNQSKLKSGNEKYLQSLSKSLGVNLMKLNSDLKSEKITARINEDMEQARQLGFQGTPGFVLNGIPIKGAYPIGYFENIIDELKKRGNL